MTLGVRRALVTGVTGQDGSYLAERLLADGVEVHGLVLPGGDESPVAGVEVHAGDLADAERLRALVLDLAPDLLVNLGGLSSVAASWERPGLTARLNGLAAVELLDAAWALQEAGTPVRFVQASSAEIFGQPDHPRQDESTPVRPVNPYGAAKALAHHAVGVYRARGLHAVSAVLYNHESPRRPTTFVTRKITDAVARISRGEQDRLLLGTLDVRRDWGWAPDYVDAMLRAALHETPDDYVVATGVSHTIRDFVAAAFAHVGIADWEPLVGIDERFVRPVDAFELCGDASRARDRLGWAPTVDLAELVARMVAADLALLEEA
ncbi:GDP-mannose 4,6-dehydratase [Alteromonas gracilis]